MSDNIPTTLRQKIAKLARNTNRLIDYVNDYYKNLEGTSTRIVIPNGITKIRLFAFANMHIEELIIPDTVEEIGYEAIYCCNELTELVLPKVKTLYSRSIDSCYYLETLYLPKTLEQVYYHDMGSCYRLKNIIFENGIDCNFNSNMRFSGNSLTTETLVAMLEALADRRQKQPYTLYLGANLDKLTDEQKEIAINKNWNLA